MQASSVIENILGDKRREIAEREENVPRERLIEKIRAEAPPVRSFKAALLARRFSLIAEIKRRSPSHGDIAASLDAAETAGAYDRAAGVSCISVLTDRKYFGGGPEDLIAARKVASKPLLRKDFILDEYQLLEARAWGADAVLLIATVLEREELRRLVRVARSMNMEPFVESHTAEDIEKIPPEADVIGINTRDLKGSLKTDLDVVEKMLPLVPRGKVLVAESGVQSSQDVRRFYDLGVRAVLAGTSIVTSRQPERFIEYLLSEI